MHVLITGANGFIGSHLARRLPEVLPSLTRLTLLDVQRPAPPAVRSHTTVHSLDGSFADAATLDAACEAPVDLVFHLAALPSGSSEQDPDLGYAINVEGTRALLERLRHQTTPARLVFTSSIAVYGRPGAGVVTDDTAPTPNLSYGAHKVMGEALVNDYSRRGWVHGCAVRIPGIVARPPEPNGAVSIFFSDLIRELAAGRPVTCPVSADAHSWLMSVGCCVENLVHAATLALPQQRSWCLPATHVGMGELVRAVGEHRGDPDIASLVTWAPDPWVEENFGSYPPLECPKAGAMGFCRDVSLQALVADAL